MSNATESKEEQLMTAFVQTMLNDTVSTGNNVEAVGQIVGTNVQRSTHQVQVDFPKVDVDILEGPSELGLPSSEYFVTVVPKVLNDASYAQRTLSRLVARIISLFDRKHIALNQQVSGLKCRLVNKVSATRSDNLIQKYYSNDIRFRVICGEENTNNL